MTRRLHQIHHNVNHFALDIDTLDLLPIGEDGDVHTETTSELSLWPHTEANTHILNERHLEKITLCVSNDCNLRCKYCYAGGGDYGSVRSLMDKNTATKFIEFCCNNYRKIDKIMFFGGEPRLNPDIIAYICEEFEKKAVDSKFPLPSFTMITNGTISNSAVMDVIRKHITHITISIDGPKDINDTNRMFPNGAGSYDRIAAFITKCRQIRNLSLHYEATYTRDHVKAGITKADVKRHLESTFGISGFVVNEDSLGSEFALNELYSISKEKLIQSDFDCLPIEFWQTIHSVILKKNHYFCRLFSERIAVTTKGYILGCQMFIQSGNGIVTSIYDEHALESIESRARQYKDNDTCRRCWCYKICGGCPIPKFYTKEKEFQPLPNNEYCDSTKKCIEECLSVLYTIYTDDELRDRFLQSIKTKVFLI